MKINKIFYISNAAVLLYYLAGYIFMKLSSGWILLFSIDFYVFSAVKGEYFKGILYQLIAYFFQVSFTYHIITWLKNKKNKSG